MLDLNITKWTSKEIKENAINKIIKTNKPIEYKYLCGFDKNGLYIYETKKITIEQLKELFSYFENYFIIEEEKKIKIFN